MAKPPRDQFVTPTNTYFVTTNAWQGQALFQSAKLADLLLATLFDYRDQQKFGLHEFVLMPNHLHVLLTPGPGVTIERAVQLFKGGFSYRVGKELCIHYEIWQRGYVDHRLRDDRDYLHHRDYIRMNPVKARLVDAPENYRYSSAFPGFKLDAVPQGLEPIP